MFRGALNNGDVANISGARIEHWNNAEYTGRLAARNMMGSDEAYDFLSTVWSDLFDAHIEAAGETRNYDNYVVEGRMDLDDPKFNVVYRRSGIKVGYFAVNVDYRELEPLNEEIKVNLKSMQKG